MKYTMAIRKKYVMPDIEGLAEAVPEAIALIEYAQELVDYGNALRERERGLRAELAGLKKAQKRVGSVSK